MDVDLYYLSHSFRTSPLSLCLLLVGDDDCISVVALERDTESFEKTAIFPAGKEFTKSDLCLWLSLIVTIDYCLSSPSECDQLLLSARVRWVHAQQLGSGLAGTWAEITRPTRRGTAGGAEGTGAGTETRHRVALLQGKNGHPEPGSQSDVYSPHAWCIQPNTSSHRPTRTATFTQTVSPGHSSPDNPTRQSSIDPP